LTNWLIPPAKHNLTMKRAMQAWFLNCLTSIRPRTSLFANRSIHIVSIMVLPLSSFVPALFCWHCKLSICDSAKWLPTLFSVMTWIHCREVSYTVTLLHCNGRLTFSMWLIIGERVMASFWLFTHIFHSGWIQADKFLAHF